MDFTRKARLVAGGHLTDTPAAMTQSSVVSRESVCIGFQLAALNNLQLEAADIGNAYLNAKTTEKVCTTAGPEFGEDEGKTIIIVCALYGLKSSSAAWHFANSLRTLISSLHMPMQMFGFVLPMMIQETNITSIFLFKLMIFFVSHMLLLQFFKNCNK